jgi:hypothetical protein
LVARPEGGSEWTQCRGEAGRYKDCPSLPPLGQLGIGGGVRNAKTDENADAGDQASGSTCKDDLPNIHALILPQKVAAQRLAFSCRPAAAAGND